jgi:hypothetical protein
MLDKRVLLLLNEQISVLVCTFITELYRIVSDNLFGNSYSIKTQVTLVGKRFTVTRTRKIRIKPDRKENCVSALRQLCGFCSSIN